MQVDDFDAGGADGVEEMLPEDVHPAGEYDEMGAFVALEDLLR